MCFLQWADLCQVEGISGVGGCGVNTGFCIFCSSGWWEAYRGYQMIDGWEFLGDELWLITEGTEQIEAPSLTFRQENL